MDASIKVVCNVKNSHNETAKITDFICLAYVWTPWALTDEEDSSVFDTYFHPILLPLPEWLTQEFPF